MPKTKKSFTIQPYGPEDKWIEVSGPDLALRVDFDDVHHSQVKKNMKRMVDILNTHWDAQPKLSDQNLEVF